MPAPELMEPFKTQLDLQSGIITPAGPIIRRHLSNMRTMYADTEAVERIMQEEGDRLIYEVYGVDMPEVEGLVIYSTTTIYPGLIGNEYHMTKGHFHARRDRSELYIGLTGQGYLLMQTEDGTVRGLPMTRGTVAFVPPYWAHRTVNTGEEPFVFLATWPGDAGHDYGTIEQTGFAQLLVRRNGEPAFVDNPRWRR